MLNTAQDGNNLDMADKNGLNRKENIKNQVTNALNYNNEAAARTNEPKKGTTSSSTSKSQVNNSIKRIMLNILLSCIHIHVVHSRPMLDDNDE